MGQVKAMWMDMGEPNVNEFTRNQAAVVRTPIIEAWAFKGRVYAKLWRNTRPEGEMQLRQLVMYRLSTQVLADEQAEDVAKRVEDAGDIDLYLWERVKLMWEGHGKPVERKPTRDELIAEGKRTGVCQVCHRKLTNPKSIEAGIGPVCAKRI